MTDCVYSQIKINVTDTMFTDESFDPVGFPSQNFVDKSQTSADTQTEEGARQATASQSVTVKDVQTQTLPNERQKQTVDYNKLAAFLKRIVPSVLEELDEIHGSSAFDGYDPSTEGGPSTSLELIANFHTLDESDPEMKISDASWSIGGGTLAVSYSMISHDTWCHHMSKIKLFNLTNEDQVSTESVKTLEVNACVTTLCYHPVEPSILTAGLFNGDVLLWNLRDDTSVSPLQICVHGESISVVKWHSNSVQRFNNVLPLVTASTNGYILIHKITANFTMVELDQRFKIKKEHNLSEKTRPRSAGGRHERAVEPGLFITSLAFSSKHPMIFVVGTLCGGLYKCDMDLASPIEGDGDTFDPVVEQFGRHEGSVTCISFSPTTSMCVTSGTDKEIRIYNLSQSNVEQITALEDTVIGLEWFPGNSEIFAAYGASAVITFYDVRTGKPVTNLTVETNGKECSALQFNGKRDIVAIGDTRGKLEIWKIPRAIISQNIGC